MTDPMRDALVQAREALAAGRVWRSMPLHKSKVPKIDAALAAIDAALAAQAPAAPAAGEIASAVKWLRERADSLGTGGAVPSMSRRIADLIESMRAVGIRQEAQTVELEKQAPQAPAAPAPLTDERIMAIYHAVPPRNWIIDFARAIERELRASTAAQPAPAPLCPLQWNSRYAPTVGGLPHLVSNFECSACGYVGKHDAHPGCKRKTAQPAPRVAEASSRAMFVARLENMQRNGDKWLTVPAVLALLNDCDMLASRESTPPALQEVRRDR